MLSVVDRRRRPRSGSMLHLARAPALQDSSSTSSTRNSPGGSSRQSPHSSCPQSPQKTRTSPQQPPASSLWRAATRAVHSEDTDDDFLPHGATLASPGAACAPRAARPSRVGFSKACASMARGPRANWRSPGRREGRWLRSPLVRSVGRRKHCSIDASVASRVIWRCGAVLGREMHSC